MNRGTLSGISQGPFLFAEPGSGSSIVAQNTLPIPDHATTVNITGAGTIKRLPARKSTAEPVRLVFLTAGAVLFHDANFLVCPGGASLTVGIGDSILAVPLGSRKWRLIDYTPAAWSGSATLASGVAGDFSANRKFVAPVNGGTFSILNPTGLIDKEYYGIYVAFATSHSISLGNKFKITGYTPTAVSGKADHLVFRYNGTADFLELVGYRNDVGT